MSNELNELNDRIIEIQDQQIRALEKCRELDAIVHESEMSRATKRIKDLEGDVLHWSSKYEEQKKLYEGAVQHVANERDEALALADELKKDVQHWQTQFDREHAAFVQAAEERDKVIRDKAKLQRRYVERGEEIERCDMQMEALRKQNKDWRNRVEKLRDKNDKLSKDGAQLFIDHVKALEFIDSICEMVACDADFNDIADECIRWRKGEWAPTEDEPNEEPHRWAVYVVEEKGGDRVFTGFFADYNLARESVDLMVARGCYEAWVEDKA